MLQAGRCATPCNLSCDRAGIDAVLFAAVFSVGLRLETDDDGEHR